MVSKNQGTTFSINRVCCCVNSCIIAVCVTRCMSMLCDACHERNLLSEWDEEEDEESARIFVCGSSMLDKARVCCCCLRSFLVVAAVLAGRDLPARVDNRRIIVMPSCLYWSI